MNRINLIYLLGAGRSGTTALAALLGGHNDVSTLGEMHQFYDHIRDNKECSCGETLNNCKFWSPVIKKLPSEIINNPNSFQKMSDKLEYHSSIPFHFLSCQNSESLITYNYNQSLILKASQEAKQTKYVLDSAKYLGRFLSLKQNKDINLKGVYMTRDVRGVINSFSKKVQSSRSPLSTIIYYYSVNCVSQWVYWLNRKSILKIRYEDLINRPEGVIEKICLFLDISSNELLEKFSNNEDFNIGHIIGGNRIKTNKTIKMNFKDSWKTSMSRSFQLTYYFLTLPLMLMNKYRP